MINIQRVSISFAVFLRIYYPFAEMSLILYIVNFLLKFHTLQEYSKTYKMQMFGIEYLVFYDQRRGTLFLRI